MFRKLLTSLMLGLAIGAADVGPPRGVSTPSARVTFSPNYFVHLSSAVNDGAATTIKVPITVTAGNALVVLVTWDSSVAATLADKLGNSFTKNQTDYSAPIAQGQATFSAINIKGGIDTITATFGASRPFRRIVAIEYTGVTGVDTSAKSQSTINPVSVAMTTKSAGDILVCAVEPANDSVTITKFNKRSVVHSEFQVFDTVAASSGSNSCVGSINVNEAWTAQEIALTTNVSIGNLPQTVTVKWKPSTIGAPDSVPYYYLEFTRNGYSVIHPVTGANTTNGSMFVYATSKDTIETAIFYFVDPPQAGKTADYVLALSAISSRQIDSTHLAGSRPAAYLFRRTNNASPQGALDSVPISVNMIVPSSFGIFGDSFKLYNRMYSDTNSVNTAAMKYIGTIFPRNTLFVAPYQLRTNRYSYYMTPFLFGKLVDTIYLGTLEVTNR